MRDLIPVPTKGSPLRASWGAAVANGVNALAAMSAPGLLAREGFTGTGCEPLPKNLRDRVRKDVNPKQFTLRARKEYRQSGNTTESRTIVEFYNHSGCEAVTWSGHVIGPSPAYNAGWNSCFTSSWSTSDVPVATIYLNVRIDIEQDFQGTHVLPPENTSYWSITNTPMTLYYVAGVNAPQFIKSYPIGAITASGLIQYWEGTLNFLDLAIFDTGEDEGSGSGSGSGEVTSATDQCFDIKSINTSTGEVVLGNCYLMLGGKFFAFGNANHEMSYTITRDHCILCLKISMTSPLTCFLEKFTSMSLMMAAQESHLNYYRPLYWFGYNYSVSLDFRNMPDINAWEFE